MSNTWNYMLVFKKQYVLSETVFTSIIETVNAFGYSIWTPPAAEIMPGCSHVCDARDATLANTRRIQGMSLGRMDELVFKDFESARSFLCSRGGLIEFWKRCGNESYDIHITFQPEAGQVSLGVLHELREHREEDVQEASDLKDSFVALCQQLEPVYGYSYDEYRTETALDGKDFIEEWNSFDQGIRKFGQPSLLFWMNYFDLSYWRQIDVKSFESVPHRKEFVPDKGVFIYLAEYPWQARVAIFSQGKYHFAR